MTYQPPFPPSQPPQPPPGHVPQFDYYAQQPPDLLGPARRAATLLFVLGALSIVSSFCCIGFGISLPSLMQRPEFQQMPTAPGMTIDMMRSGIIVLGIGSFAFGITYIVLGVFVRRGSKGAAITALVITILAVLLLLMNTIGALLQGQARPENALAVCMLVVPLALMILLMVWLVGAMRAADHIAAQKYAMDYWRYAQQQQGFHPQQQQPLPPPQFPPQQPPPPPQP